MAASTTARAASSWPGPPPRIDGFGPDPTGVAVVGLGLARLIRVGAGVGRGVGVGLALGAHVEGAVGTAVGGGVGGAVGTGVGGEVGVGGTGVAGPWTTMVPFIDGWIEQWYAYVPASANGMVLLVVPAAIWPVSNAPVSDVAVWASGPTFCHVMLSPVPMIVFTGANAKFRMATVWLAPNPVFGTTATIAMTSPARRMQCLRRIR